MQNPVLEALSSIKGISLFVDEPLKKHTGFKTGGNADLMAIPQSKSSFIECIRLLQASGTPFFVLGNGSNVFASDDGYRGVAVKTEKALGEVMSDGSSVTFGAGVSLADACHICAKDSLTGLEFAYGIPGTVGGAAYMNAGAYDGEMKDVIASIEAIDRNGNIVKLSNSDMAFAYRFSSAQQDGLLILNATFSLRDGDRADILGRMEALLRRRREKQPLEYPSCGSTFKRPPNSYASKLIDDCGLRGLSVGDACVSEKHCGFIINKGNAASRDIVELIETVKRVVFEKTGIMLECEIKFMN